MSLLAVSDLHVHLGEAHVLKGIDFDVAEGGVTALLGRNGVGKTTTLRALLNGNRVLLVDEPTKGLAPLLVTEVARVLERVSELTTVLLVEQNLGVVQKLARDAIVLDTGRVVHIGPAQELLADRPMVHRMLGVGAVAA